MKYIFDTILTALVADIAKNDTLNENYRIDYRKGKFFSMVLLPSYKPLIIGFAIATPDVRRVRINPELVDRMEKMSLSDSSARLLDAIKQGQAEANFAYNRITVWEDEIYFTQYNEADEEVKHHVVFWNEWTEREVV